MFVKKLFTYLTAHISKSKISFNVTSSTLFSYKDEDIGRCSNLH